MKDLLKQFSEVSSRKYTNLNGTPAYAYAAGYYESLIESMYNRLPKADREFYLKFVNDAIKNVQEN